MKRLLALAVLGCAAGAFAQTPSLTTARAALPAAIAAAQKWQPDAVLTGVSGMQVTPEGKARKWGYLFFSAKVNKGYSLDFAGAKLVDELEVRPHVRDAVTTPFIDSDQALGVAKQNGVDTKGQPLVVSLLVMGQATKAPASVWTVGGGFSPGAVAVMVDSRSGKFLYKQSVPQQAPRSER